MFQLAGIALAFVAFVGGLAVLQDSQLYFPARPPRKRWRWCAGSSPDH